MSVEPSRTVISNSVRQVPQESAVDPVSAEPDRTYLETKRNVEKQVSWVSPNVAESNKS